MADAAYAAATEAAKRCLAENSLQNLFWGTASANTALDMSQAHNGVNPQTATLLSGMPVPSPVSHAKQQADARIAELEARLAAAEAALADAALEIDRLQPLLSAKDVSPFARALATWPGRGGVDQWSGMPMSVGRWVK